MASADSEPGMDELSRWHASAHSRGIPFEDALSLACERVVAVGFPLWQVRILMQTQHPEVAGVLYQWRAGEGTTFHPVPHDITDTAAYRGSPVEEAQVTARRVRVVLESPAERGRFRQLAELASAGVTDYIAEPLLLGDGRVSCLTAATKRPGGFSEADIAMIDRLVPMIAVRLELRSAQDALRSLLGTYLGPNAAKRVLGGAFRRGTGETLRAAIWFCDMRGFTSLSDRLPAREVVSLLDQFFETIAASIEEHHGEILKFIGDAVLAVFPVTDASPSGACRRALAAAEAALVGVEAMNGARAEAGLPTVSMGVALHVGEVMYGNIGGRKRLDFTVIGAAVNEASRLESLCKALEVPLLMSGEFARASDLDRIVSMGVHALRGVSAPQEVFTLAGLAPTGGR